MVVLFLFLNIHSNITIIFGEKYISVHGLIRILPIFSDFGSRFSVLNPVTTLMYIYIYLYILVLLPDSVPRTEIRNPKKLVISGLIRVPIYIFPQILW